jgi:hypothetical protein
MMTKKLQMLLPGKVVLATAEGATAVGVVAVVAVCQPLVRVVRTPASTEPKVHAMIKEIRSPA